MAGPTPQGSLTAAAFLRQLVGLLETSAMPYMITGSFASTFHGSPRATHDLDVVIDPDQSQLATFVAAAQAAGLYVDESAAGGALSRRSQFNVIDSATGWKADLVVRKDRPFSTEEFRRRRRAQILGVDTFVATPEDMIVAKLEWAARSGSERQLSDVSGILRVRGADLDRAYVERWVEELGLGELWQRVTSG